MTSATSTASRRCFSRNQRLCSKVGLKADLKFSAATITVEMSQNVNAPDRNAR